MSIRRRAGMGFTLIEIMVVMLVLMILVCLLLPAITSVREVSRRATCINRLRQLCVAVQHYHDRFEMLPMSVAIGRLPGNQACDFHGWSIHARILPDIDEHHYYDLINFKLPVHLPANTTVGLPIIATFTCPSVSPRTVPNQQMGSSYAWCMGGWFVWGGFTGPSAKVMSLAPFAPNRSWRIDQIQQGISHTVLVGHVNLKEPCTVLDEEPTLIKNQPIDADQMNGAQTMSALQPQTSAHTDWRIGTVRQTGFTQMPKAQGCVVIREESNSHLGRTFANMPSGAPHRFAVFGFADGSVRDFRTDDTTLPFASSFRAALLDQ